MLNVEKNYGVIMAGGVGSRFFPMSTNKKPKQFLDILGLGKTLLQMTFERLLPLMPLEQILVLTHADYVHWVLAQLPDLPLQNILIEPERKNTAPCIAYANYKIQKRCPDARVLITPADHLIKKQYAFQAVAQKAFTFCQENDVLLTLGIVPNKPETGYGYIEYQAGQAVMQSPQAVFKFREKPPLAEAEAYIDKGNFLWNAGLLWYKLDVGMRAFATHLPEVQNILQAGVNDYDTAAETAFIRANFPKCPSISMDYGVLEKANNVFVLGADMDWSDLGTWTSVYEQMPLDNQGNFVAGKQVLIYDTQNSLVRTTSEKVIILQGLKEVVFIETQNAILLCHRSEEQRIKNFVEQAQQEFGKELL
jgi:mannose-1-phosphate guanylyltransferase